MTRSVVHSIIIGIATLAVVAPLHAQMMAPESAAPAVETAKTVAEVQTDGGVVMISDGGAYQTASPGQRVKANANLMVSKESAATVVYDDGCKQKYDKPGIYQISETCVLPAAIAASGGPSKALIIGGIVLGAIAGYEIVDRFNDDDDDGAPISR